jgi:hypothetical protein
LFGTNFQSQFISNAGTGIFWQSFNGNYSSLQQINLAIIPNDFDSTSNVLAKIIQKSIFLKFLFILDAVNDFFIS